MLCITNTKRVLGSLHSLRLSVLHGLEELFSSCAVVSVFGCGGKLVLVLHTYYQSQGSGATPGIFKKKRKIHADPATRALNHARFTDHRPPPFLASSNTLHPSRPIFCCIGDQTPPPTSPKSSPPLSFIWCSILGNATCL